MVCLVGNKASQGWGRVFKTGRPLAVRTVRIGVRAAARLANVGTGIRMVRMVKTARIVRTVKMGRIMAARTCGPVAECGRADNVI